MAYVKFYMPTNMDTMQTWYGDGIVANGDQIVISDGYRTGAYGGHFDGQFYVTSGVLTDYTEWLGGAPNWLMNGLWVDAPTAQYFITTNQLQPLFAIALAGNDWLDGSFGDDLIRGYTGDDVLFSGAGHDWLLGGDGGDVLAGEIGNDVLVGESGNDWLLGGEGLDYINGGQGADLYDMRSDVLYGQMDLLAAFNPFEGDAIILPAAYAGSVAWQQYGTDVIGLVGGYGMYVDGDLGLTVAEVQAYTLFI